MMLSKLIKRNSKSKLLKNVQIFELVFLSFLLIAVGNIACKKAGEEATGQEAGQKERIKEFEGSVKVAVGPYLFVPSIKGFDVVVPEDKLDMKTSELVGKQVRGKGLISEEMPSILVVQKIELKNEKDKWEKIYEGEEKPVLEDYLDLKSREEFQILDELSYDEKSGWENVEKAKVLGRLNQETVTEEGKEKIIYKIVVLDENDKAIGRILVDNISDSALFYSEKLKLFDKFWFYIEVKDTVDWNIRQKTAELFHADVLFAGLF
ncbi:MAG: hypothetical protein ACOC6P_01900 [Candidatus Aminicenantaceae bacterium]